MEYLVILLDDTSISYCNYLNTKTNKKLIPLDILKQGLMFAMKHNLMVHFVFPDYKIPENYRFIIESVDNKKISLKDNNNFDSDIIICDNFDIIESSIDIDKTLVIRVSKSIFFKSYEKIISLLNNIECINIIITDIESFSNEDFKKYKSILEILSKNIAQILLTGKFIRFNLLTDRIFIDEMNNCNAGVNNITLAPNGKFYICPAFYIENENDIIGDLENGLKIINNQLYKYEFAPICRNCDAFHCKRCIWLNRKTTLEINTPSHEQCVMSHLERNESEALLNNLHEHNLFNNYSIDNIDYLDPYEKIKRNL